MFEKPQLQSIQRGPNGRVFQVQAHYHPDSNQHIVFWDDIVELFPGTTAVLNGTVAASRALDASFRFIEPRCIWHQPGKVLDVVLEGDLALPSFQASLGSSATTTTFVALEEPAYPPVTDTKAQNTRHLMLPYAAYPVHPTPPIVPQQQQQQQQRQQNVPEIRHLKVLARAQALYDFPGGDTGDLLFKTGDIISVIEYSNDDWWRGVLGYEIGVFPSAYVQRLKTPLGHVFKSIAVSVRTSTVAPPPTDHAGYVSTPQHHYLDDPPPYS